MKSALSVSVSPDQASGIACASSKNLRPVSFPPFAHPARPILPGLHLIGDLYGCQCDSACLLDDAWLAGHCRELVEKAGLTAVGDLFHGFGEGGGVTGMIVLAESHMSLHTWPEAGYVTLDVYVCNYASDNRQKAKRLFDDLVATFRPADPHFHSVHRA